MQSPTEPYGASPLADPLRQLRRAVTLILWGMAASSLFQLASAVFIRVLISLPDQQRSGLRWVSPLVTGLGAAAATALWFGWRRYNALAGSIDVPDEYGADPRSRRWASLTAGASAIAWILMLLLMVVPVTAFSSSLVPSLMVSFGSMLLLTLVVQVGGVVHLSSAANYFSFVAWACKDASLARKSKTILVFYWAAIAAMVAAIVLRQSPALRPYAAEARLVVSAAFLLAGAAYSFAGLRLRTLIDADLADEAT